MQPYLVQENGTAQAQTPQPFDVDSGLRLERSVEGSFGQIQSLPLFNNLPHFVVFDILKSAHVVTHDKGALILTQGETLTHFYILLEGWVRLFRNSPDGRETTLQLLGKRDFLFEGGISSPPVCPQHVQVVERVRILTLPLSLMREHFSRSAGLAENILALVSQRTLSMISHMENLTLRNAKERVGFFFLKIWMETNPNGQSFTLPFDKSLIAAYLDIRAETFSRILKDFQTDGFVIKGQEISLPNGTALCRFCDPATALFCNHAQPSCTEPPPVKQKKL